MKHILLLSLLTSGIIYTAQEQKKEDILQYPSFETREELEQQREVFEKAAQECLNKHQKESNFYLTSLDENNYQFLTKAELEISSQTAVTTMFHVAAYLSSQQTVELLADRGVCLLEQDINKRNPMALLNHTVAQKKSLFEQPEMNSFYHPIVSRFLDILAYTLPQKEIVTTEKVSEYITNTVTIFNWHHALTCGSIGLLIGMGATFLMNIVSAGENAVEYDVVESVEQEE